MDPEGEELSFWLLDRIVNIIGIDCYGTKMTGTAHTAMRLIS